MPFGAVYGTLFFVTTGIWLISTASQPVPLPAIARFGLAAACLAVGIGLPLRRAWARWTGIAVTAFLVGFQIYAAPLGEGVAANLILFGGMVGLLLLLAPGTGDVRRGASGDRPQAPRLGRVLAAAASAGVICVAAGLWQGTPVSAGDAASGSATPAALENRVSWANFGSGLARAQAEGKPVLVSFEASWCGFCRKMDRTTWRDPEVVRRASDLVTVRVDAEDGRERDGFVGRDLADRFGIQGFPTLVMLDARGHEIARTGGYQDADQLLQWLDRSVPPTRHRTGAI